MRVFRCQIWNRRRVGRDRDRPPSDVCVLLGLDTDGLETALNHMRRPRKEKESSLPLSPTSKMIPVSAPDPKMKSRGKTPKGLALEEVVEKGAEEGENMLKQGINAGGHQGKEEEEGEEEDKALEAVYIKPRESEPGVGAGWCPESKPLLCGCRLVPREQAPTVRSG